jgi:hypothetical protein
VKAASITMGTSAARIILHLIEGCTDFLFVRSYDMHYRRGRKPEEEVGLASLPHLFLS